MEAALYAISLFLLCYKGYENIDIIAGWITGIADPGVILFPTSTANGQSTRVGVFLIYDNVHIDILVYLTASMRNAMLANPTCRNWETHVGVHVQCDTALRRPLLDDFVCIDRREWIAAAVVEE